MTWRSRAASSRGSRAASAHRFALGSTHTLRILRHFVPRRTLPTRGSCRSCPLASSLSGWPPCLPATRTSSRRVPGGHGLRAPPPLLRAPPPLPCPRAGSQPPWAAQHGPAPGPRAHLQRALNNSLVHVLSGCDQPSTPPPCHRCAGAAGGGELRGAAQGGAGACCSACWRVWRVCCSACWRHVCAVPGWRLPRAFTSRCQRARPMRCQPPPATAASHSHSELPGSCSFVAASSCMPALQELLSGTAKYLSAQAALQSAFKTTGGSSGSDPTPPAGGPD